jgi:YjbE family integral membrane protein
MELVLTSFFWVTLGQIMMINIMLSGDNAVVIAMASRALPPKQQKQAILFGSFGAIFLRIILTFFAVLLLALPWLKLVGGALLLYIGIKMLIPDDEEKQLDGHTKLWAAIKTIIVADLIMSLDNVLGVAAAAKGNLALLIIGLAISIPLIIYGSTLLLKLMNRYPIIITAGGGILGWVAGEMAVTDPVLAPWVQSHAHWLEEAMPAVGAIVVVVVGKWLAARAAAKEGRPGEAHATQASKT